MKPNSLPTNHAHVQLAKLCFGCVLIFLGFATQAQTLKLRVPLDGIYTGINTTAPSDTAGGGANVTLTMINSAGAATDYHGQPGSNVAGNGRAMDFSSVTYTGGNVPGSGPVTATTNSALGFGAVSTWTATFWMKQSQLWTAGANGTRFFSLGAVQSGDGGNNNLSLKLNTIISAPVATMRFQFGSAGTTFDYNYTQVQNAWVFCAAVYDGATFKIYLGTDTTSVTNVASLANLTGSMNFGATPYLYLGNRQNQQRPFAGWMQDFRFYSGNATAAFLEDIRLSSAPAPTITANLVATPLNGSINLSWSAQPNAVSYYVKRSLTSGAEVTYTNVTTNNFTDTGLVNGTTYYYVVTGTNANGESPVSSEVSAMPAGAPAAPTGLVATLGDNQVGLTWNSVATATGYNVKRSTTSGSGYVTLPAGSNVSGTSFTDLTANSAVTYYYVVTALNPVESVNSSQASATPAGLPFPPTGLSAAIDVNQVMLTWSAAPGAAGYYVKRGDYSGGEATIAFVTTINFTDNTAVGGQTYYYEVTSTNIYGEGGLSGEVSGTPLVVPTRVLAFHLDDSGTNSLSDTNGGAANVLLNLYQPFAVSSTPLDIHGASGSGVGETGKALNLTTAGAASTGPVGPTISSSVINPTTANLAFGSVSKWTASLWIKRTSAWTANEYLATWGIDGKQDVQTAGVIGIVQIAANKIMVDLQGPANGNAYLTATLPGNIPLNQWCYIGVTYDAAAMNLYFGTDTNSATLVATGAYANNVVNFGNTTGWVVLGASGSTGGSPFKGYLDDFRFYTSPVGPNYIDTIRQAVFTLAAPTGLAAMPAINQVALSWNPPTNASPETPVTYNVKRSTVSGSGYVTLPLGTGIAGTNFTDITAVGGTTYYYVVSAVTFAGEGANSTEINALPTASIPGQPQNLVAVPTNHLVTLTWNATTGATSYNVKRATSSGAEATITNIPATGMPSYADTNVLNGTTYYYTVSATNSIGQGVDSAEVSATPLLPPAPPTGLNAVTAVNEVDLTWVASVDPAAYYNVKRATNIAGVYTTISTAGTVTGTGFNDTTAYNGPTYYYVISAVGIGGEGSNSVVASATPTGPPQASTNLIITPGIGNLTLTWNTPIGLPTSFNVNRGDYSGGEVVITNITGNSFVDTNVNIGQTYYYTVSGVNAYGTGAPSPEVMSAAFGVPPLQIRMPFDEVYTGTSYYPTSDIVQGTIDLTLTNYNYAASLYNLIDLSGPVNSGVGNNGQALNQTTVNNQGGTPDLGTYVANNLGFGSMGIASTWTASIWFKPTRPVASSPSTLFVVGQGGTTYAGLANSVGVRTYATNQLSVRLNGGIDRLVTLPSNFVTNTWYFVAVTYDGVNMRTYVGTELSAATLLSTINIPSGAISFANNFTGSLLIGNNIQSKTEAFAGWLDGFRFYNGASDAGYIDGIRQAGLGTVLPFQPVGLTATPSNNVVSLKWNSTVWATGYNVKRSTTSGTNYVTLPTGGNVTATNFTDLTAVNGTTYYYVVSGVGTNGEGANSIQVSATPVAAPTAPTILSITPGNTQITLTWSSVAGASTYNVKRSTTSGAEVTITNTANLGFIDTGLVNGTTYYYTVSAVNISGESANSSEASAQPVPPPAAPTGLAATPGDHQISLSWNAVSGATNYNIKYSPTSGGTFVTIGTSAAPNFLDPNAINGLTNHYVVSALGLGGESPNSAEVSAIAGSQAQPVIGGIFRTGGNGLSIVGSGTPSATYALYGSTNLADWSGATVINSGTFDATSGMCTNPVTINSASRAMFFRLKSPYP